MIDYKYRISIGKVLAFIFDSISLKQHFILRVIIICLKNISNSFMQSKYTILSSLAVFRKKYYLHKGDFSMPSYLERGGKKRKSRRLPFKIPFAVPVFFV